MVSMFRRARKRNGCEPGRGLPGVTFGDPDNLHFDPEQVLFVAIGRLMTGRPELTGRKKTPTIRFCAFPHFPTAYAIQP